MAQQHLRNGWSSAFRLPVALVPGFLLAGVAQADEQGVINTIVTATDGSRVVVNVQQKDLRQATQDIANSTGD